MIRRLILRFTRPGLEKARREAAARVDDAARRRDSRAYHHALRDLVDATTAQLRAEIGR